MGGGVSIMEGAEGVEQLMTTALMIGRAISAVAFPGMYRIYDFHSKKAPKLKNGRKFTPFFSNDSDDEEDEDENYEPNPADYAHFFHVRAGGDTVYIEDPLQENEAGWTPLHACCMSLQTVEAGMELIEEMARRGGHFDTKTVSGPGTFNRGWTALQMACAYGVEPLVEKLVEAGADVNAINSFGYSCMLEACHRGYIVVVKHLLKGKVDLAYIPPDELASNSPFASAPCQSALAEAARSGFFKVVQTLLDAGAPKDLGNCIGWTALHEACFYNRIETVKTLLLGGASATVRTRQGALPYHLACIPDIKAMLESMGGPEAVPNAGDTIDMLAILTELTMGELSANAFQLLSGGENEDEEDDILSADRNVTVSSGAKTMPAVQFELAPSKTTVARAVSGDEKDAKSAHSSHSSHSTAQSSSRGLSPMKAGTIKTTGGVSQEEAEGGGAQPAALLHSGPLLGNLPAFGKSHASPKKFQTDLDHALLANGANSGGGLFGHHSGNGKSTPSKRADDKTGGKKKKRNDDVAKDTPTEFLCQLTQRLMTEPVKTIYGNVYDRTAIMNWLTTQGKICPLTGAPLSEADLTPNEELGQEIKRWVIMRSTNAAAVAPADAPVVGASTTAANDDLYDF